MVDGEVANTAGNAVRTQISQLSESIPVIDKSLSVSGAAADAKVVGDNNETITQRIYNLLAVNEYVEITEIYEHGELRGNNGEPFNETNLKSIRTKNFIEIIKNGFYEFDNTNNDRVYLIRYHLDKSFMDVMEWNNSKNFYVELSNNFLYKFFIISKDDSNLNISYNSLKIKYSKHMNLMESNYHDNRYQINMTFELGHFNPYTGIDVDAPDTLRTKGFYYLKKGNYYIWNPDNVELFVLLFNNPKSTPTLVTWANRSRLFNINLSEEKYIRISTKTLIDNVKLYKIPFSKLRTSKLIKNDIEFYSREGEGLDVPISSVISIKKAYENGYDGYRFNICKTSDNYYVLSHDETINRVARNSDGSQITNNIIISQHTLAELNQYDYGIQYGTEFAGQKITLFEDGIKACSKLGLKAFVEWKYPNIHENDVDYIYTTMIKNGFSNKDWKWVTYNQYMTSWFKAKCDYVDIHVAIGGHTTPPTPNYAEIELALSNNHNVTVGSISTAYTLDDLKTLKSMNVNIEYSLINSYEDIINKLEQGFNLFACSLKYPKDALLDYALLV